MLKFDPATVTLIQAFVVGIGGFIMAIVWGVYDRRRVAKKELAEGSLGERQALSKDIQTHIDNLERDAATSRLEAEKMRLAHSECFDDRHSVWEALHAFAESARDMRHDAIGIIFRLCLMLGVDPKAEENQVPKLNHVHDFYKAQKEKRTKPNA